MIAFTMVLLDYPKYSLSKDASGTFDNGNCKWKEEHITGSKRGFVIKCCKPKVSCKYQGDPHKCKDYYVIKKKQKEFYQCLAKDSLHNAENACSKSMVQCEKECGETANFYKVQFRRRRASIQETGTDLQCSVSTSNPTSNVPRLPSVVLLLISFTVSTYCKRR